jgi:hypothetical protein
MRKGLLTPERVRLMQSRAHFGFNVNSSVRIDAADATGWENLAFKPLPPADEAPHAKAARASWARYIKKVFAADPLECPDCGGSMRIVAFIEEPRVVRAILEHLSLWDKQRAPPASPAVSRTGRTRVPALGGVSFTGRRRGVGLPRNRHIGVTLAPGGSARVDEPADP